MWSWAYHQISCPHTFHFEYVRDYFDELKDYNKFAIVFNALIHDNLNYLENAGIIHDSNLIFHLSLELLTEFWETKLKVA